MDNPAASILVLDDVPDNLQVLSDILIREGFQVRPVTSAAMAFRTLEAALPQLILADIKMPGMDGYEFCRRLKAEPATRDIPVIFISALGETKDKVRAFEAGGVDYITKPFQGGEVLARVRTHLTLYELGRSLSRLNGELEDRVRLRTRELEASLATLHREAAERARAEQELRSNEAMLELALSSAGMGVWSWDLQAGTRAFDPRVPQLLGVEPGVLGASHETFLRLLGPEDRDAVDSAWNRMLQDDLPYEGEFTVRWPDGSEHTLQSRGRVLRDAAGRPLKVHGVMWDITQRKASENLVRRMAEELEQRVQERTAQLESANVELEAFSYSVSHDLRAPLRNLDGFSLALKEDYQDRLDETGRSYLEHIHLSAQRMGQLIDDLLKLSHINRTELNRMVTDLSALWERIAADLACAGERQVEVAVQPGMLVLADSRLLQAMLENLMGNAWKFTSRCPRPRIEAGETSLPGGARAFFIRDNGAGFDMAQVGQLFHPFHRLHSEAEYQGTGIGLAIVQRIVHRHGGRVWAEAEPGRGAAFFFTLPGQDG
ncbi:MAG: response regulator [Holophaga sp.]|nr:response regulator [Holophaga sp.]